MAAAEITFTVSNFLILYFSGAPRIKATPVIQHQMVGYQSKMACVVESSPSVTQVWWRKDDQDILPESDRRLDYTREFTPSLYRPKQPITLLL